MGEVITFTSGKGGVGKTTSTANVGVGLSQLDKKVLLIDTDIGLRNLDVIMGLEKKILYNLVDVLNGRCRLKQAIIRDKRFPNLSIIPSSCIRENRMAYKKQMKDLLEELKLDYDYILIDSPAGIEDGFDLAICGAEHVIIVTTPQVAAIHDADCVLRLLKDRRDMEISLLINSYQEKLAREGNILQVEDIQSLLQTKILGVIVQDIDILISQNHGVPIYEKSCRSYFCYENVCRRIIGDEIPIQEDYKKMFRFYPLMKGGAYEKRKF